MLFILAGDTLAVANRVQAGIQIEQEHRFSLYSNDFFVLFFLNKSVTIPNLMQQIIFFTQLSSSTSTTPSQLFLNKQERLQPVIKTPFINTKEGLIYLGTYLVLVNYDPLVGEVKDTLH